MAGGVRGNLPHLPRHRVPSQVAIKAMSLKGLKDWKQLELFQREAVVLQGLSHPSIPK